MEDIKCKKCASYTYSKAGFVNNKQRYKCKICHCLFLPGKPIRHGNLRKQFLVKLYTEGSSLRSIGRLLGISHVTAMRWVKLMAKNSPR